MILSILSFLTGRKIVWLEDFQGDLYRTIEIKSHPISGKRCAYVYWFEKIKLVTLNDDGTVGPKSCYIEKWRYEKL